MAQQIKMSRNHRWTVDQALCCGGRLVISWLGKAGRPAPITRREKIRRAGARCAADFKRCWGDKTMCLEMWQELCEFFHKRDFSP
jgi:hypothetical protein